MGSEYEYSATGERNQPFQSIHTRYNGYHFRSRTEARWAVFFDHLRVEYKYEPQGYRLHDGSLYLPDFYLPMVRYRPYHINPGWLEIKSVARDKEKDRCQMLAEGTGEKVFLAEGYPHECNILSFAPGGSLPIEVGIGYKNGVITLGPSVDEVTEVLEAAREAKSARFEHGETPDPS